MFEIHFFKAKSRLGLIAAPINQSEQNFGVENGSNKILDDKFLKQLSSFEVSNFEFPLPENVLPSDFWPTLAESIRIFKDFLNSELKSNQKQVVIGGDHSVTLPSVLAVLERIKDPNELGYI